MKRKSVKSNMGKQHDEKALMKLADGGMVDGFPRKTPEQIAVEAGFPTSGQPNAPYVESNQPLPAVPSTSLRTRPPDPPNVKPMMPQWVHNAFGAVMGVEPLQVNPATSAPPKRMASMKDGGHISLKNALRHGEIHYGKGKVKGPGGPREDKVPAMLSDGEYVIPADVVERVGKDNLDDLVNEYHEYSDKPSLRDGMSHLVDGGLPKYPQAPVIKRPITAYNEPYSTLREPVMATSPEARAHVEATRPASAATPAPRSAVENAALNSQPKGALYKAGRFTGEAVRNTGLRPAVPGAGGAAGALVTAPVAMKTAYDSFNTPTEVYRRRLGMDENAGSVVGDVAARTAGVVSDLGANVLDLGTEAVNAGRRAFGAEPIESFNDKLRAFDGPNPAMESAPVSLRTQPPQVTPNVQTGAIPSEPTINEGYAPPVPSLRTTTTGNMSRNRVVSNEDGSDFRVYGQVGPDGKAPTISITSGPDNEEYDAAGTTATSRRFARERYNEARSRALDPRYQQAQAENDARIDRAASRTDSEMASLRTSIHGPQEGTWDKFFADRNARKVAAQQADLQQRERESLRTAGVNARGQDMTARTAANAARIEQQNKDRQYQLEREKFNVDKVKSFGTDGSGGEVGRANDTAKRAAEEAHTKRLEAQYTTKNEKGESVVDKEAVAEHKQAAEAGLGGIIARLKSTGNPADAAKARALAEQGARGLDDADHNKIRALLDVKRRAKATHSGIDPFGTKFRDSNDPFDYEINQDDWKSGKEDIRLGPPVDPRNPNGPTRGGTIRRNHLRYNEPANVILPDWKIPTSRFDPAKGTLRQ